MKWRDLNIRQKSEVIKMAVRNGVTDLNEISRIYDDSTDSKPSGSNDLPPGYRVLNTRTVERPDNSIGGSNNNIVSVYDGDNKVRMFDKSTGKSTSIMLDPSRFSRVNPNDLFLKNSGNASDPYAEDIIHNGGMFYDIGDVIITPPEKPKEDKEVIREVVQVPLSQIRRPGLVKREHATADFTPITLPYLVDDNDFDTIPTPYKDNMVQDVIGERQYGKGGSIHIKPENRGKFNATKKRTGKTTEELTHSKNPLTRKRAIFAQNARKWKHAMGGNLYGPGGEVSSLAEPIVYSTYGHYTPKKDKYGRYILPWFDEVFDPNIDINDTFPNSQLLPEYQNKGLTYNDVYRTYVRNLQKWNEDNVKEDPGIKVQHDPSIWSNIFKIPRERLYNNVAPFTYENTTDRALNAIFLNSPHPIDEELFNGSDEGGKYVTKATRDLWAKYLDTEDLIEGGTSVKKSRYKPALSKNPFTQYYTFPLRDKDRDDVVNIGLHFGRNGMNRELGNFTIGRGHDRKGDYVSFYDIYDINPHRGVTSRSSGSSETDSKGNLYNVLGEPFEIYDRIYLDDYYGVKKGDRGTQYLPAVDVFPKGLVPFTDEETEVADRLNGILSPLIKEKAYGGNLFKNGGSTDDNPPVVYSSIDESLPIEDAMTVNGQPVVFNLGIEPVIKGKRMPSLIRRWNKTFRTKKGYEDFRDKWYNKRYGTQDTDNIQIGYDPTAINVFNSTPDREGNEHQKQVFKSHQDEINKKYTEQKPVFYQSSPIAPVQEAPKQEINYHPESGLAYLDRWGNGWQPTNSEIVNGKPNPSAGYLSGTDPIAEFYVMGKGLDPAFKLIGRGAQWVLGRAGNQWARNQIASRTFNNAANKTFGYENNKFIPVSIDNITNKEIVKLPNKKIKSKNTIKFNKAKEISDNVEFLNKYNEFARKYGYEELSPNLATNTKNLENAVVNRLNQHNTFIRGVEMPYREEDKILLEKYLGKNYTEEEALKFIATHGRTIEDDYLWFSPFENADIYGADKTALIRRPFKLSPRENRMNWFDEAEFPIYYGHQSKYPSNSIIAPWSDKWNPGGIETELVSKTPFDFVKWKTHKGTRVSKNYKANEVIRGEYDPSIYKNGGNLFKEGGHTDPPLSQYTPYYQNVTLRKNEDGSYHIPLYSELDAFKDHDYNEKVPDEWLTPEHQGKGYTFGDYYAIQNQAIRQDLKNKGYKADGENGTLNERRRALGLPDIGKDSKFTAGLNWFGAPLVAGMAGLPAASLLGTGALAEGVSTVGSLIGNGARWLGTQGKPWADAFLKTLPWQVGYTAANTALKGVTGTTPTEEISKGLQSAGMSPTAANIVAPLGDPMSYWNWGGVTNYLTQKMFGLSGTPVIYTPTPKKTTISTSKAATPKYEANPTMKEMKIGNPDYSFPKGNDVLIKYIYQKRINGKPSFMDTGEWNDAVTKGLSPKAKMNLQHNTVERNIRQMNKEGYSMREQEAYRNKTEELMNNVNVGRYSDYEYTNAGENDIGGFYDNDANFISINRGSELPEELVEGHEGRHLIDHNTSLLGSQETIVENAYDKDFLNLPNTKYAGDGLKGYKHMNRERVTTNRDSRDTLFNMVGGRYADHNVQDKIIDNASDAEIFEAVRKSNGYGKRYIEFLEDNNGLTPEKANQFRNAMKYVGALAPIGFGLPFINNR